MSSIFFSHGKAIDGIFCEKCRSKRGGKIIRERFRWIVRLLCGHIKFMGYTCSEDRMVEIGISKPKHQQSRSVDSLLDEAEGNARDAFDILKRMRK